MAMIILALTVASAALFFGGILTGVMLSGPGGPLAELREGPPPQAVVAPPPRAELVIIPEPPEPAPPVVVIEPPLDQPPVAALPAPQGEGQQESPQVPPTPFEAADMEKNPLEGFPPDTDQASVTPTQVIPQAKPVVDSPPKAEVPADAAFAIQAGAFANKENADKRASALIKMGYQTTIKAVAMSSGSTLYVVSVGAYATPRDAAADRRALRAEGIETALTGLP
jgi:cell division septation protein DedD